MSDLITAIALIFGGAALLLVVADRFDLPAIPIYILAGVIVGPFVVETQTLALELAQWGIVFLAFVFGVRIEPGRLDAVARDSYPIALVQLVVVGALGYAIGLGLGFGPLDAFYFAVAAALSSSLVGLELMERDVRRNFINARLAESIHFVQDVIAVVLLLLLGAAAFTPEAIQTQLAYGTLVLFGGVFVRRYLFSVFRQLSGGVEELLLLTSLSTLMGFVALAELLGVSIVVGAFAAGLAVASDFTENAEMLNGIDSLTTFFAAIFFVSLGTLVAVPTTTVIALAVVLFVLTVVITPLATIVMTLREGYGTRTASQVGFDLDQVSELALIIAIEAFVLGRIAPELFEAIVLAGGATMISSSFTHRHHDRLWRALIDRDRFRSIKTRDKHASHVREGIADHVILVGFGEQGRTTAGEETEAVGDACADFGIELAVIDNDPEAIALAETQYDNYVFGDILDPRTWEQANHESARLVVSTIADREISEAVLDLTTDIDTMLTAADSDAALSLLERGAFYVNVPDVLAAEQLAEYIEGSLSEADYCDALREQNISELQNRIT